MFLNVCCFSVDELCAQIQYILHLVSQCLSFQLHFFIIISALDHIQYTVTGLRAFLQACMHVCVSVISNNNKITTYLAVIRGQLQRFCHSLCSFFRPPMSLSGGCTRLDCVTETGFGTRTGTGKVTGMGARINLFLEAADNISSAHMGLEVCL